MQQNISILQRVLLFGLFFCLILLSFEILKYFIVPVVWAAIISYVTWPIYRRIWLFCGQRKTLSALLMTCGVIFVIVVPLILGIIILQHEARNLFLDIQRQIYSGTIQLPKAVYDLPVVGREIKRVLGELNNNPKAISDNINIWIQGHLGYGRLVLAEISKNAAKMIFVMMTLFFFYRDGRFILEQVQKALAMVIGDRIHHYLATISETTRAVVYGIGLTAVAQALLAGISYVVAGVNNPLLLTLITFVLALIPFGTPFAYIGVALFLFSQGQIFAAIGVVIWGICIVSSADNVIRPLVISGATKIPFLLIMFGVLGGIASFGFVGLFIGPVILAVLLACWREWLQETIEQRQE